MVNGNSLARCDKRYCAPTTDRTKRTDRYTSLNYDNVKPVAEGFSYPRVRGFAGSQGND